MIKAKRENNAAKKKPRKTICKPMTTTQVLGSFLWSHRNPFALGSYEGVADFNTDPWGGMDPGARALKT